MKYLSIVTGLLILLIVVSCGVDKTAEIPTAPYQTSFAAARAESQATGRDFLVDFYTDW